MSSEPGVLYGASALRTPSEEFLSALTHGIGMVLSIVAGLTIVHTAWASGDARTIAGCGFYAVALIAVYTASTLSHLYLPADLNRWFRQLDQGCIYLLIAGSFTPFALRFLGGSPWIGFWAFCLLIAVGGFLSKTVFAHRLQNVSIWLYVSLGWCEALAILPLWSRVPHEALLWMIAGGVSYTVGTVFLVVDLRRYHFHAIWHVLVMVGSACHFFAIFRYVAAV